MTFDEAKAAIKAGRQIDNQTRAQAIAMDKELLFGFLLDNNLVNINHTLRMILKQEYLPFIPDRKAIEGAINLMIAKNDLMALNTILQNFDYNAKAGNYTIDPDLLIMLKPLLK